MIHATLHIQAVVVQTPPYISSGKTTWTNSPLSGLSHLLFPDLCRTKGGKNSNLLCLLHRLSSRYVRARARYAHTWKRLLRTVDFHLWGATNEKEEIGAVRSSGVVRPY